MNVRTGLVRPPQIHTKEHTLNSTHTFQGETQEVWNIRITACDSRLTDVLARAISNVLYSWGGTITNAEENVLRELGRWEEALQDIARDPREKIPPPFTHGTGNGGYKHGVRDVCRSPQPWHDESEHREV